MATRFRKDDKSKDRKNTEAEVHMIGELDVGWGFDIEDGEGLFVEFSIQHGQSWLALSRMAESCQQTQTAFADESNVHVWNQPLDFHWVTDSLTTWPRLRLQVWKLDRNGRLDVVSYGTVSLPCTAGHHELTVSTWTPRGLRNEELYAAFCGSRPQLMQLELIDKGAKERHFFPTSSSGKISLTVDVVLRNFAYHQIEHRPFVEDRSGKANAVGPGIAGLRGSMTGLGKSIGLN
uniref:B9 domain-containing protein 2 n=1 Tax=Chromera velia CCMP2878 TaxID=1169474 RepID=A0A0G4FAD5_9ALVE|mmetsp:Transcript_24292/g.47694  ORF Transcript_24292/g.47694 Transcript_24292/m.47694 type:complete len:234 (-) Transcript_24292:151-852(-)|eukprot:Cvel_15860.t1-p1 / transcript=Cvel_15860.t1 / gene=Cvel_15860 / organism=Chromera_velia_CCMP2878 / gene_product=B9 domain-containing protein 2, putative / transcript_product=B9 domain-containing protein 2, putative / location=Cvel_scaffold1195:47884-50365(-) / protein_length=233 / sequence_SO=supercontig / SO=protein_coding / is_pseudo=false